MLNEQKIRDLYLHHIGSIKAERAAGTQEAPFMLLELEWRDDAVYAYATLGASDGPLHHELVLDAIEPFAPYGAAVEAIARGAPALEPGAVIPLAIPDTPFTALLCLPVAAEESFALSRVGAPRVAFRLAPLTAAEQALAETDPSRVLDLLRAAFALTADRYRPCLVDVPAAPPSARTEIALERRRARAGVRALQADVLREHGRRLPPEADVPRRRLQGRARCHMGSHAGLSHWAEWTIREAVAPYIRHPAPVVYFFAELIYVTFATHPDAVRLIERAVDPRNLPLAAPDDPGREAAAASQRVTAALAIAVARCHPTETEAALLARARPAIEDALSTFDPVDEIPIENHVWTKVLPAMYEGIEDLKPPAVRGLPKVFRRVAENEAMLEYEPDPRPPLMRLGDIAARLAIEQVTAYAAGLRGQLPG
jgi:hypothetical protein